MNETGPMRSQPDPVRVLRDVVIPVLDDLLHPGEVEYVKVSWRRSTLHHEGRDDAHELVLNLICVGESFWFTLWRDNGATASVPLGPDLYSALQDFIAESRFAWGERRGTTA